MPKQSIVDLPKDLLHSCFSFLDFKSFLMLQRINRFFREESHQDAALKACQNSVFYTHPQLFFEIPSKEPCFNPALKPGCKRLLSRLFPVSNEPAPQQHSTSIKSWLVHKLNIPVLFNRPDLKETYPQMIAMLVYLGGLWDKLNSASGYNLYSLRAWLNITLFLTYFFSITAQHPLLCLKRVWQISGLEHHIFMFLRTEMQSDVSSSLAKVICLLSLYQYLPYLISPVKSTTQPDPALLKTLTQSISDEDLSDLDRIALFNRILLRAEALSERSMGASIQLHKEQEQTVLVWAKFLVNSEFGSYCLGEIINPTGIEQCRSISEIRAVILTAVLQSNPSELPPMGQIIIDLVHLHQLWAYYLKNFSKKNAYLSYLAGADIHCVDDQGETNLMLAIDKEDYPVINMLIKLGVDVNVQNHKGHTALMFAACKKNPHTVRKLLRAGADVNLQADDGLTALIAAERKGKSDEIIEILGNPTEKQPSRSRCLIC